MDVVGFFLVATLVIVTPGQDTALTIRNTLRGRVRGGVFTALGVSTGQALWALATSAGVAGLLVASEPAFTALKLLGAAYLVYLGAHALWDAFRSGAPAVESRGVLSRSAFRQGVISNLGNPKMAIFFPSLLPQAVQGDTSFSALLLLGLLFSAMTFTWLCGYALAVRQAGDLLRRSRIRRAFDAVTGIVLVGFGLRIASQHR